jgi:molybdate transport system substrate-binding protein
MVKVLDRLGIAGEVNAKAKLGRGVPVATFLLKGEADLAIQQIPELMGVQGVEIVGPLPGDLQNVIRCSPPGSRRAPPTATA